MTLFCSAEHVMGRDVSARDLGLQESTKFDGTSTTPC